MDSHMTAVESNKRHKAAGLLAALVLVLILVGWIYYVFSPKELSNVLDFQPSEATDYTVTEMPNAVSSKSRSLDDTPLIEMIDALNIRYCGPSFGVRRFETGQHIYEIWFFKVNDQLEEIGNISVFENGYIYLGESKYEAVDQERFDGLPSLRDDSILIQIIPLKMGYAFLAYPIFMISCKFFLPCLSAPPAWRRSSGK